jgi:hypothetical protein
VQHVCLQVIESELLFLTDKDVVTLMDVHVELFDTHSTSIFLINVHETQHLHHLLLELLHQVLVLHHLYLLQIKQVQLLTNELVEFDL